jgi:hypothetical protein
VRAELDVWTPVVPEGPLMIWAGLPSPQLMLKSKGPGPAAEKVKVTG